MAKKIHISEDEQLEKVKKWWKDNGVGIISGIVLGLGLMLGYNWWQKYQDKQAIEASAIFSQLILAHQSDDIAKVSELSTQLKENYSRYDYTKKGITLAAMSQIKAGDIGQAKANLNWIIKNSDLRENKLLATFKLARQLYREANYEEALALIQIEEKGGFASQYYELIGDIEFKRGNLSQSHQSFLKAMELLPTSSSATDYREILQLKIDNTVT